MFVTAVVAVVARRSRLFSAKFAARLTTRASHSILRSK